MSTQPNKTRVQVATDSSFSTIVLDKNGSYTTSMQVLEDELPKGVNLYARGMHGHPTTGDSSWSSTVQFKIKLAWTDWDGSANGLFSQISTYDSRLSTQLSVAMVSLNQDVSLVIYPSKNSGGVLCSFAMVVRTNGTIVQLGEENQLITHRLYNMKAVKITETKVLLFGISNVELNGYLLTISENSVLLTTQTTISSTPGTTFFNSIFVQDNYVFVCYSGSGGFFGHVISASSTSITKHTSVQISPTASTDGGFSAALLYSQNKLYVADSNVRKFIDISPVRTMTVNSIPSTYPYRWADICQLVKISENRFMEITSLDLSSRISIDIWEISGYIVSHISSNLYSVPHPIATYRIEITKINDNTYIGIFAPSQAAYPLEARTITINDDKSTAILSEAVYCHNKSSLAISALNLDTDRVLLVSRNVDSDSEYSSHTYARVLVG